MYVCINMYVFSSLFVEPWVGRMPLYVCPLLCKLAWLVSLLSVQTNVCYTPALGVWSKSFGCFGPQTGFLALQTWDLTPDNCKSET